MAQAIPNLCVSRRMLLKYLINWTAVCDAKGDLPWRSVWTADNQVKRLNVHLPLLIGRFVPTKVRVRNKNKPWFNDDCRRAFDLKPEAHLRWTRGRSRVNWNEFVHYQRMANVVYMPRLGVSLVSEAGMIWWTPSVRMSGGPPSDLFCLARGQIRLFLLLFWGGWVVVWSVSRSRRLKCCLPILMESSQEIL